jgi:hypothetical protein
MSITLSRATYKLSKDQAAALGTLLGSIKATVMETKVDGDSITVTTTPEVQQAIGQIIRLIQGQGGNVQYRVRLNPDGVAPPAMPGAVRPPVPSTPAKPAAPAKPGEASASPERINVNVILEQLKAAGVGAEKVDVQAIIEKALKEAGLGKDQPDAAKLKEMKEMKEKLEKLKSSKAIELKLNIDPDGAKKKPEADKKPEPQK